MGKVGESYWSVYQRGERDYTIFFVAFLLGLVTIICQIIFLRESLESFSGNELSIGLFLGSWLLWTGIGSRFSQYIASHRLERLCMAGFPLMLLLFAGALFVLPWIRNCVGSPGQIVGIVPTGLIAFIIQAPGCLLSGLLFTAIIRLDYLHRTTEISVGIIYFWECLGSVAGGLLATLILLPRFGAWGSIFLLLFPVMLGIVVLGKRTRPIIPFLQLCLTVVVVLVAFHLRVPAVIDRSVLEMRWPSMTIVDRAHTPYGAIVIVANDDQLSFYESGLFITASGDRLTAEQQTHPILVQHKAPRDVLVVGGSFGGVLPEILLHGPERIVCVELDPGLVSLAAKHLPGFDALIGGHDSRTASTRIEMIYGDGRHYVHQASDDCFDVLIINLPDPSNALLNRFFTLEFFQQARRVLRPGGIISFSLHGADTYIDDNVARYLADMTETVSRVFPHVLVLPGIRCRIIASNDDVTLIDDADIMLGRLDERGIKAEFFNQYFIPYEYSRDRLELFSRAIASIPAELRRINRDFSPVSYYWSAILWSSKISLREMNTLLTIARIPPSLWLILLFTPSLFAGIIIIVRGRKTPALIMISVGCAGFCVMTTELCLFLAFQVLYGYTYEWMGLLLSMFMAGMAAGSLWISRRPNVQVNAGLRRRFERCLLACGLTPLLLVIVFSLMQDLMSLNCANSLISLIFPIITLFAGVVGGCIFPAAVMALASSTRSFERAVSGFYWSDLAGAASGAVIAASLCIPLLGLHATLGAASLLMFQAIVLHRLFQSSAN